MSKEVAYKYIKKIRPTLFDSGIGARLPDAYKKFYDEWRNAIPEPIHFRPYTGPTWVRNEETGEVTRKEVRPIPLRYPPELNNVFTGGESVVLGFVKRKRYTDGGPHFWMPRVYRSVIYSEILDKYFSALITKRLIELIHKHEGLDTYLLETRACDIKSLIALKLKRRLLLALHNRDFPYDEQKNNEILMKYEKYLIPHEEIEWYGLSFGEACKKLEEIEEAEKVAAVIPLKQVYRAQLIQELKEAKTQKDKPVEVEDVKIEKSKPASWFQKLPGLRKDSGKS